MDFILVSVDCDRQGRPLAGQRVESLGKLTNYALPGSRCLLCQSESTPTNGIYLGDSVDLCENCLHRSGHSQVSLEPISLSKLFARSL